MFKVNLKIITKDPEFHRSSTWDSAIQYLGNVPVIYKSIKGPLDDLTIFPNDVL